MIHCDTFAKHRLVVGLIKVGLWASFSITVRMEEIVRFLSLITSIGVDACNTVLEVLLFAAATNLGQGWNTVLTLFGGKSIANLLRKTSADVELISHTYLLRADLG